MQRERYIQVDKQKRGGGGGGSQNDKGWYAQ